MQNYCIPKGWHKSLPLGFPRVKRFDSSIYEITMDESCIYEFKDSSNPSGYHPDQKDWNKGPRGRSFHFWSNHINSFMGGWRWNPWTEKIDWTLYCHVDRKRVVGTNLKEVPNRPLLSAAYIDPVGGQTILQSKITNAAIEVYNLKMKEWEAALDDVEVLLSTRLDQKVYFQLDGNLSTGYYGVVFGTGTIVSGDNHHSISDPHFAGKHFGNGLPKRTREIRWWFGGNRRATKKIKIKEQRL